MNPAPPVISTPSVRTFRLMALLEVSARTLVIG